MMDLPWPPVSAIAITAADSFQNCHRMVTVCKCQAACLTAEYSTKIDSLTNNP